MEARASTSWASGGPSRGCLGRQVRPQAVLGSIVQMPSGIPTATFAIGDAGATNAGLFAVSLIGNENQAIAQKLADYRESLRAKVEASELPPIDNA